MQKKKLKCTYYNGKKKFRGVTIVSECLYTQILFLVYLYITYVKETNPKKSARDSNTFDFIGLLGQE
jgi:hypothetical protein